MPSVPNSLTAPAPAAAPAIATGGRGGTRRNADVSLVVVALFVAAVLVMLTGFGGRAVNVAYVALAVLTGSVLFVRSPSGYVSFTLWLWFLSPFVRRVFDLHTGWNPASPVLVAPPAVALLSTLTIVRRFGELRGILYAPYLAVLLALAYGYAVGMINAGVIPATYALVTWLAPAFFGLHLALSWRQYPKFGETVRNTFIWAVPILGAYGVYQFVNLPAWDAAWMVAADMRSIGAPRPFLVRVFGTLNAPGPFAAVIAAGSLYLLSTTGRLRSFSIAVAMVALLLARTRAMWVAFIIGLVVQQIGQPLTRLPKRTLTLIAVALLALPLASIPQFSARIAPRMKSLSNLSADNSFVKRYNFSQQAASSIVETAEGNGLGTTGGAIKLSGAGLRSFDNGFLEIFYIFGWPGGVLFFLGIGGLLLQTFRFRETRSDSFANAARATTVAIVAVLPIGDVFTGATGTLLWMSIGFGIAGHAYHLTTGQALRSQYFRASAAARRGPGIAPTPVLAPGIIDRPVRA